MNTLPRLNITTRLPLLPCLAALLLHASNGLAAHPFDCESSNCNLRSTDTYPHIVIGTVQAVATEEQARQVYRWAKGKGYWQGLPDNEEQFIKLVQVMSVEVPAEKGVQDLTLLMAKEEYDTSPLVPGDYVRYTPHTVDEPQTPLYAEPIAKKYWDLFGCIAALCRSDDPSCAQQYTSGIYGFQDGIRQDGQADGPLKKAARIDTQTYLPLPETTKPHP